VLTEVKAYSSWPSAPSLLLSESGRAESDLIQIRNIEGLDPVKASVNTSPYGSIDGEVYTGGSIPKRNLVFTVHPNPDWDIWTYASLRRLLYFYFMPKKASRLVFYSDDIVPVEISGIVESVESNLFSEDPELLISIICPDPYFVALEPKVIAGQSIRSGGIVSSISYEGNVEAGIQVKIAQVEYPTPSSIEIQIGDPASSHFLVETGITFDEYFEMKSLPGQKLVQNINLNTGVISNLLNKVEEGSSWPVLQPGENDFSVVTDAGVQDWELTYYERFGGL
jgi:hypothetical protein